MDDLDNIVYYNEDGQFHREDGLPAVITGISKKWYVNGKLHREGGPAVVYPGIKKWYLNNIEYTEEQYKTELVKLKLNRLINENRTSR